MPYRKTYPILYDRVPQIDIRKLCKSGLVKPAQKQSTSMVWRSDNGAKLLEVFVKITTHNRPYVELRWEYHDERIKRRVYLTALRYGFSNSRQWYFIHSTGKIFRKLFFIDGKFLSMNEFKGFYEIQTKSRKDRQGIRLFHKVKKGERAGDSLYKKYFRPLYKGRPTKRYLQLMQMIAESENITAWEIEKLYFR